MENDPSALVEGRVNAITGELVCFEEDLVIRGAEPIRISRALISSPRLSSLESFWAICGITAEVREVDEKHWVVAEKNGSPLIYQQTKTLLANGLKFYRYEPKNLNVGVSNTSHGKISSRSNLRNNYIVFDHKFKFLTVHAADGTLRYYKKMHKLEQFRLLEEKLPNGNWVVYDYSEPDLRLISICTMNPKKEKVYAKADFVYEDLNVCIVGSDGQSVQYFYEAKALSRIVSSQAPECHFNYIEYAQELKKTYKRASGKGEHRLRRISLPLKRTFSIDYYRRKKESVAGHTVKMEDLDDVCSDPRRSRVKMLAAPVGFSDRITHQFVYDIPNQKTSVFALDGRRSDYTWGEDLRLQAIEHYDKEGVFLRGEQFVWGCSGKMLGNLLSRTHLDAHRNALWTRSYVYDARGNVLEETFCGDLSIAKHFVYSSSEPNLLIEQREESGLRTTYTYLAGTDLPTSEFTYDRDQLKKRSFWEYDADHILVREIVDDGASPDKNDLTHVLTRQIRCITPMTTGPYLGMPYAIEEKYWENGQEHLLKRVVLTYTTGGRIQHRDIFDADGAWRFRLSTTYDGLGRVESQTNALGQVELFSYDACGNRIKSSDFSKRFETHMEYDLSNRMVSMRKEGDDSLSLRSDFFYDDAHHLIREVDHRGVETLYTYDALGRRIATRFPEMDTVVWCECDSEGNEILKVDGEGNQTRTIYNAYGQPLLVTHPDGKTSAYHYFPDGSLKKHIDAAGVAFLYEYDYLGRRIRKTVNGVRTSHFSGGVPIVQTAEYHGQHLIAKTDAEGNRTVYTYDGAGRRVASEFGGERTSYGYDALGRRRFAQTGDLVSIREYDLLGRVIEERKESIAGNCLRKTAYEYDASGNQKTIVKWTATGEAREQLVFDSLGRMIRREDPVGAVETILFCEEFNQKIHTDPLGLQTIETSDTRGKCIATEKRKHSRISREEKVYNKNGQVTRQTNEVFEPVHRAIETRWEYDQRGRLMALVEGGEKVTRYTYTPRGELERIVKPDGSMVWYESNELGWNLGILSSDGTVSHHMQRDRLGRMLASDQIQRTLDAHGRVLRETFPKGFYIENRYNRVGQRVECSIPAADCRILYEYNPLDLARVSRIRCAEKIPCYAHTYGARDLSGNVLWEESPAGIAQYETDLLSRKTAVRTPYFTSEILEFDAVGNVLKTRIQGEELAYAYDDLYQLIFEPGHQYAYDGLHNRLQKDGETCGINHLNQDVTHFVYDANGNTALQGDTRYTYDALDRLIRIETPVLFQMFTYDSLHRCLAKTTIENNEQETRYFLYDGQNEIGSFDERLRVVDLRVLGQTTHAEIGASVAIELQGEVHVPIHDLHGNVADLIALSTGNCSHCRHTAFGEPVDCFAISPWRFSSKRTDARTGLVYYGRRFYSPTFGRWLSPDPSGFGDGMNLYAFVRNDPLNHLDEYGLVTYDYRLGWVNCPFNSPYSLNAPQYAQNMAPPSKGVDLKTLQSTDPYAGRAPHYYVNGILNNRQENYQAAQTLLQTYDNRANITPLNSETTGFVKDLFSVHQGNKDPDYSTFDTRRLNRELRFHTTFLESLNDPRKVFITSFSKGAADTYHAVKDFSQSQKERLIITACGPTMLLPRDSGFRVMNIVSPGDWCSAFCRKIWKSPWTGGREEADVITIGNVCGLSWLRQHHFFHNPAYHEEMKKWSVPLYREYGELNE